MGFFYKKRPHPGGRKPAEADRQAMLASEQHRHYTNNLKSYTGGKFAYEKSVPAGTLKKSKGWITGGLLAIAAAAALLALPSADPAPSDSIPEATAATIAVVDCAATEAAHTHAFAPATCDQPQTCVDCGQTQGSALGHDYLTGVCVNCQQEETTVWIPRTGDKYHSSPNCSNMIDPTEVSISYAIAQGYPPCSKCY